MFLHLGGKTVVPMKNIIGIFHMEHTTVSSITKDFLRMTRDDELVETVMETEIPKTFVLIQNKNTYKVILTPISASTLSKRLAVYGKRKED